MPQVYFIGGAPRVGKSTLALKVSEHMPLPHASTDSIRSSVRQTTTPEATPDLFYLDSLNADEANMAKLMRHHSVDIIAAADAEAAAVWPAVEALAHSKLGEGKSVLIEGVAVLPSLLATLELPYSAVFLGNQSADHTQIICDYAKHHPDTWLGSLQPDTVEAFAEFSRAYSAHTQREAQKYNLPYFEMSTGSFPEAIVAARQRLLS
jgi:2-phosphoglycerate kinase